MRTIAVLFGFLFAFMLQAQTYLDEGNVWSYATIGTYDENHTGNAVACDFRFVKYYINGETIINGRTYKNICSDVISYITEPHHMFSQNDDNYHTSSGNYMISLREQDNIIYVDSSDELREENYRRAAKRRRARTTRNSSDHDRC